jgi:phosphate-selective porin
MNTLILNARSALRCFAFLPGIAALAASATPAVAAPSVEERLAALEAEVRELRAENKQLRQDLGVSGTSAMVVAKPAGKEPVLAINGLVQAQAEFGDRGDTRGNANDRFRLRRVRLGASGRFLEEFDFKVEGEFAGSGVTLTDGYLNWSHFDWANVKAGQFKTPFGYEFLAPDPKLYTIERSFGTDRLTLNRQVGVQVSGAFFEKQLSYAAGIFNGNGSNITTNDVPAPLPMQHQLALRAQVIF